MDVPLWVWFAFVAFVALMLALDLFVFHREAHEVSFREATLFSAMWVALGLVFGVVVWTWQGATAGGEYYAGYLIEKALSVDNVFVFALIFTYFSVPAKYQHRVLFWGWWGRWSCARSSSSSARSCSSATTGSSTCSRRYSSSPVCVWPSTATRRSILSATRS